MVTKPRAVRRFCYYSYMTIIQTTTVQSVELKIYFKDPLLTVFLRRPDSPEKQKGKSQNDTCVRHVKPCNKVPFVPTRIRWCLPVRRAARPASSHTRPHLQVAGLTLPPQGNVARPRGLVEDCGLGATRHRGGLRRRLLRPAAVPPGRPRAPQDVGRRHGGARRPGRRRRTGTGRPAGVAAYSGAGVPPAAALSALRREVAAFCSAAGSPPLPCPLEEMRLCPP